MISSPPRSRAPGAGIFCSPTDANSGGSRFWNQPSSGSLGNCLLPARLGEFFRVDYLGRLTAYPRLTSKGTVAVERTFDGPTVLALTAIGVLLQGTERIAGTGATVVLSVLLVGVSLFGGLVAFIAARGFAISSSSTTRPLRSA